MDYSFPHIGPGALRVAGRNFRVWRKLIVAGVLMHILEPLLYLVALGYGLGIFIREMSGMTYQLSRFRDYGVVRHDDGEF